MNSKEIKDTLSREYPIRIELHAHSKPVSPCSEIEPKELIDTYKAHNYDALVLTNHYIKHIFKDLSKKEAIEYYLNDFKKAFEYGESVGLKVFLGVEYRFTENNNDYLIYGADRELVSLLFDCFDMGVERFRKEISLPKSLFIQAHPLRRGCELCNTDLLDGIETLNLHPYHNSQVGRAVRIADKANLKITTVGSDFHHKNVDHEAVSALRTKFLPKDSFHLAEILKSGDYLFEIGENALVLP